MATSQFAHPSENPIFLDSEPTKREETSRIACQEHIAIWRKGYGPEGGEKLDSEGWKKYFDAMDPDAYHMMLEDVYTPPRPQPWLAEVDHSLTKHCPAFEHNPGYQLIWQKGYGPQGVDIANMDVKDWDTYLHETMDPIQRASMFKHVFPAPPPPNNTPTLEELKQAYLPGGAWYNYSQQIKQSEGFDIYDFPGPSLAASIVPLFKDMSLAKEDEELIDASNQALKLYNTREGTRYKLQEVVKANIKHRAGYTLFITFQAVHLDHNKLDVFQAKVFKPRRQPKQVQLVRIKELQMEPDAA